MIYKALLVGLGQIGMGYDLNADPKVRISTLARAFSEHPKFELVGGVDVVNINREKFQSHYSCPSFSTLEAAIKETAPDIIAISTPTQSHYQVMLKALKLGKLKAILCEKPLSYDFAEASEMVELASNSEVPLFTNYTRRCDCAVVEVRRRISSKQINGYLRGVCWYSKGIFNNGSHFLNLFQYWLGDAKHIEIINSGRLWNKKDPEPDLKIEFELGEVYFLAAREEDFSHHTVELVAANGRLRYEQGMLEWRATINDINHAGYIVLNPVAEIIKSDPLRMQWYVVDKMARYLSGENTSICTGLQGLATLQLLTKIKNVLRH